MAYSSLGLPYSPLGPCTGIGVLGDGAFGVLRMVEGS